MPRGGVCAGARVWHLCVLMPICLILGGDADCLVPAGMIVELLPTGTAWAPGHLWRTLLGLYPYKFRQMPLLVPIVIHGAAIALAIYLFRCASTVFCLVIPHAECRMRNAALCRMRC